jgi:hypothetical protein
VLVAGGDDGASPFGHGLLNAELYDSTTGLWTATGVLNTAREEQTATLLPSGNVLVAGGISQLANGTFLSSVELYDSTRGSNSPPSLTCSKLPTKGSFQITFTNTLGALFTACTTTNPALSLSNWMVLGVAMELPPGQYQFTDTQATNRSRSFYRVSSP